MEKIEQANAKALQIINDAQPTLVDVKYAYEVFPGFDKKTILHAGPPIQWEDMCGPMKGAVLGAIRYEGLADTEEEAEKLVINGEIKFSPNHHWGAVGPMTGMTTYSMPVFVVKNEAFGNCTYCTINEGLGKVMRFGANNDEVIERLKWLERALAPALKKAIALAGGINLKVIAAQALTMGDEMHQRNVAASSLFLKTIIPYLIQVVEDGEQLLEITEFIAGNEQFFLNLAMAMGKATMDPAYNIPYSTVVTAMCRNGKNFGIRVSCTGDQWFEAPVEMPKGLYFPGFSAEDANPDMGDSAIVESFGLGGFCMATAPAVVRFVGAGTFQDAINYSKQMYEITVGKSTHYILPNLDFEGTPTGIDVIKVVDKGIAPVINTGIAHKEPGVGQVGAGVVNAPMGCFEKALVAIGEKLNL
ncbi:MAG TPA: DUF1116 domain-containing protein [Clostridia bacterium]|nr:DUF1116 domain-containing protein [Clostridia bacterium]